MTLPEIDVLDRDEARELALMVDEDEFLHLVAMEDRLRVSCELRYSNADNPLVRLEILISPLEPG